MTMNITPEMEAELCLIARWVLRMPGSDGFTHDELAGAVVDYAVGAPRLEIHEAITLEGYVRVIEQVRAIVPNVRAADFWRHP